MIKSIAAGVLTICLINLVPYLMALVMFLFSEKSIVYDLAHIVQSLFSIPTSVFGFALQHNLGEFRWILANVLGMVASSLVLSS